MGLISLKKFFQLQSAGGILLLLAALLAVVLNNSALSGYYDALRQIPLTFALADATLSKPLLLWVNDGLMAIFFFLVGLELKREVLDGQLSSKDQILLPLAAAFGGIFCPALIYIAFNFGESLYLRGWAIPAATDIAFALGVLYLFGKRVPLALKVFLTALAIFDDVAAILIIAFFYTSELSLLGLAVSALCLFLLYSLNRSGQKRILPYAVIGLVLWVAVLKSGVHATLAGVALAMFIPFGDGAKGGSPLKSLEHSLHSWVAYGVLPVFAFFNAGISFEGIEFTDLAHPIVGGTFFGLFIGKQLGAFGASYLLVRSGMARLPAGINFTSLYACCVLSGVGFTMSLFIGGLAFSAEEHLTLLRLGVFTGSFASGALAIGLLAYSLPQELSEAKRRQRVSNIGAQQERLA